MMFVYVGVFFAVIVALAALMPKKCHAEEGQGIVYVTARFTAKPEFREALLEEIRLLRPTVHAEVGCIRYDLLINDKEPNQFTFYEEWESKEALADHAVAPHMAVFREKTGPMRDGVTVVETWHKA